MRYWHFVGETLRNGDSVPADGVWLKYKGLLKMCVSGLHASPTPFKALLYAPGPMLCQVELGGEIIKDKDKYVASQRRIIRRMDATELLRYFARMQALSVIHLWDTPDVVLDYLMTGEESLRAAARAAAGAAAGAAARPAARAAAWAAAAAAAWTAAGDAAWAAAWAVEAAARAVKDARDASAKDFNDLVYESFQ
jgi:hypothetical protein